MVLHTAGSDLKYHPHIHMIVSRGGKLIGKDNYKAIKGQYLCPQRELGADFKIRMCQELRNLYEQGKLKIYQSLKSGQAFSQWMNRQGQKHWIVSIQQALDNVQQIVSYVGRYTKRACLSEFKLLNIEGNIEFKFNDYKNTPRGEKPKIGIRSLEPVEFLDRLLQHVPNKGYKMVRYYGLYNSAHLKDIPQQWKLQKTQINLQQDEFQDLEHLWIDCPYKNLRKALVCAGFDDPFYCKYCNQNRVLYMVIFENKTILCYETDTS